MVDIHLTFTRYPISGPLRSRILDFFPSPQSAWQPCAGSEESSAINEESSAIKAKRGTKFIRSVRLNYDILLLKGIAPFASSLEHDTR